MRADSWTDLARNLQSGRASEERSCVFPASGAELE